MPLVLLLQLATVAHTGAQVPSGASLRMDPAAAAAAAGLRPELPSPGVARADSTMNWKKVGLGTLLGAAGGAALIALVQGATNNPDEGPEYVWGGALLGAVIGLFAGLAWGSE